MSQIDESQLTEGDSTARQIPDPLGRLRYLQSVASAPPRACRWKSGITIGFLTLVGLGMVAVPLSLRLSRAANAASPARAAIHRVELEVVPSADVWFVEKASDFETYSNGLRIENQYAVSHRPGVPGPPTHETPSGPVRAESEQPVEAGRRIVDRLRPPPPVLQLPHRPLRAGIPHCQRKRCRRPCGPLCVAR